MKTKPSGWKYYLPDSGENIALATDIKTYEWSCIVDAEDAAKEAAEDQWDNRDGWEAGVGEGPVIVVVSPDGEESQFATYREPSIVHIATEIE